MDKRTSIAPTYDSRETGPRYHVTYQVAGRTIQFQHQIDDPFGHFTVYVGWRDLLRALLHRVLVVDVLVGADREVMEDVLELDANYLGTNCTRRDEFNAGIQSAISSVTPAD
jgi:hypothetical protein